MSLMSMEFVPAPHGRAKLVVKFDGFGCAQAFEKGMPAVEAVHALRQLADIIDRHALELALKRGRAAR